MATGLTLVAITSGGRGEIWLSSGDRSVHVELVGGDAARAAISLVLDEADIPENVAWASGLAREGDTASLAQVARATDILLTVLPMLADDALLCWQASRSQARLLMRYGRVTVLRGSAREGNPYPPLAYTDGGRTYADDHLLALRKAG